MSLSYVASYESQCAGKVRYPNSRWAKRGARRTQADFGGRALSVYRCPHCDRWWHCGHASDWGLRQARGVA